MLTSMLLLSMATNFVVISFLHVSSNGLYYVLLAQSLISNLRSLINPSLFSLYDRVPYRIVLLSIMFLIATKFLIVSYHCRYCSCYRIVLLSILFLLSIMFLIGIHYQIVLHYCRPNSLSHCCRYAR